MKIVLCNGSARQGTKSARNCARSISIEWSFISVVDPKIVTFPSLDTEMAHEML